MDVVRNKITFGEVEEIKRTDDSVLKLYVSFRGVRIGLGSKIDEDDRLWLFRLRNNRICVEYSGRDLDEIKEKILKDEECIVKILRMDNGYTK